MHTSSAPRITLLVTGSTGFLGSAIVAELLSAHRDIALLFLIRAENPEAGRLRLTQSVRGMLADPALLSHLTPDMILCGDLQHFAELQNDPRVQRITHILHAAALASFAWKPEIWQVNVEQTSQFARTVAQLPAMQRFLHVGTAMISGDTTNQHVHETQFPAKVRHFVPYTKSKAEIEPLLPTLLGRIPVVIARPSIVVGHSRTGCRASPSIFWVFRMIHAAKRVPFKTTNKVDIIPVDFCARALITLTLASELAHACYHISAGDTESCTFDEIDAAYTRAEGLGRDAPLQQIDVADLSALEPQFESWFGPCDTQRMSTVAKLYRIFAGLNVTFNNQRMREAGIAPPPRFVDYLPVCQQTGEDQPIAEQMLYDFR